MNNCLTALRIGLLWGGALLCTVQAASPTAKLTLNRSYGGAVVSGTIYSPKSDAIVGAWSGAGFARLMQCIPLCKVVPSIPLKNTVTLGSGSTYRIALGGQFVPGQKVRVVLRFKSSGLVITQAVVNR